MTGSQSSRTSRYGGFHRRRRVGIHTRSPPRHRDRPHVGPGPRNRLQNPGLPRLKPLCYRNKFRDKKKTFPAEPNKECVSSHAKRGGSSPLSRETTSATCGFLIQQDRPRPVRGGKQPTQIVRSRGTSYCQPRPCPPTSTYELCDILPGFATTTVGRKTGW